MTEAESNFPQKFVYPNQEALFSALSETSLIGKSEDLDKFYFRFTEILSDVWSTVYENMGWVESYAWERALKECGIQPIGSDLPSFSMAVKSLRIEEDATRIISKRKKIIEKRNQRQAISQPGGLSEALQA